MFKDGFKESIFFTNMVDELEKLSEHDPELAEGIKWMKQEAQKRGITLYQMTFIVLYEHDIKDKYRSWLNSRN